MKLLYLAFGLLFSLLACSKKTASVEEVPDAIVDTTDSTDTQNMNTMEGTFILDQDSQAVVSAVSFTGNEENYTFNVRLESPDTGCDQYADWWEVFNEEGELLYRRILAHSHVGEQPFSRSGGPINIKETDFVYVRGHMNNLGYGSLVFGGTVKDGFEAKELPIEFAADLEETAPLPTSCAF